MEATLEQAFVLREGRTTFQKIFHQMEGHSL
jgi:hypothetical protein